MLLFLKAIPSSAQGAQGGHSHSSWLEKKKKKKKREDNIPVAPTAAARSFQWRL
jgi:hypothetical protein